MEDWRSVLAFWFGDLDEHGLAARDIAARWWRKDDVFDREIGRRFGELHEAAARGERASWRDEPRSNLALVIVLDQFSRNLHRDTPGMYACDAAALSAAEHGIERGDGGELAAAERTFLYMPLMHAEDLACQERCVELMRAACEHAPPAAARRLRGNLEAAEAHRDIVRKFGRFPHRNHIVGRPSTPDEVTFLARPGSSF